MLADTIVFVDDDPAVLDVYRSWIQPPLSAVTFDAPLQAADWIRQHSRSVAIVVSNLARPSQSGPAFHEAVKHSVPQVVHIGMAGDSNRQLACDAVNQGALFRFLTKPCRREELLDAIAAGLKEYELLHSERELLTQTLRLCVTVLADMLSIASPAAFGRACRICSVIKDIAQHLEIEDTWRMEIAAVLSHLGYIALPEDIVTRAFRGEVLAEAECRMVIHSSDLAFHMLQDIPRIDDVKLLIRTLLGETDALLGHDDDLCLEGAVLRVAAELDMHQQAGADPIRCWELLSYSTADLDSRAIAAGAAVALERLRNTSTEIKVSELRPGMVLASDIVTNNGPIALARGQALSAMFLERLRNIAASETIQERCRIWIDSSTEAAEVVQARLERQQVVLVSSPQYLTSRRQAKSPTRVDTMRSSQSAEPPRGRSWLRKVLSRSHSH